MEKERGKIIELVRKCLALSKSPNEHEAAAAAAKAQELLFKYNLSLAQIEATADPSEVSKVTEEYVSLYNKKNQGRWKVILITRIAQYNFCDILLFGSQQAIVIGKPHNIQMVQEINSWLVEQVIRLTSEACRIYNGHDRIPTFRRSFLEAAANTIGNRLYEQWKASQAESESSTALVINHGIMIKNYMEVAFPKVSKGRSPRGSSSYDGHIAGREAGEKVSLTARKKISSSKRLN